MFDDLVPGMEANEDVRNVNGDMLLVKGTVLTDRHLRMLKMWGVETVQVTGDESTEPDGARPALAAGIIAEAEKQVAARFKHVDCSIPAVQIVRRLAVSRIAHLLSQGNRRAES